MVKVVGWKGPSKSGHRQAGIAGVAEAVEERHARPDDRRVELDDQPVDLGQQAVREGAATDEPDALAVLGLELTHPSHGVARDDLDGLRGRLTQRRREDEVPQVGIGVVDAGGSPTS